MTFSYVRLDEAKAALAEAHKDMDTQVMRARAAGETWAAIARELGVSKQTLHKRYHKPPTKTPQEAAGGPVTEPMFSH
jgi:DNA invertase Pin-like site-specific DNA recombinase